MCDPLILKLKHLLQKLFKSIKTNLVREAGKQLIWLIYLEKRLEKFIIAQGFEKKLT